MAKSSFAVRHYRSSVKGRRPQPADMDYGDLAVNYNHEDPALIIKGDDNTLIEFNPGSVTMSAVAPAAAKDGDLWFNTNNLKLYAWYDDGSSKQWVSISQVGPKGDPSTVPGPKGADSTVPGPAGHAGPAGAKGADSIVPGPAGPKGADSTVAGPAGAKGDKGDKGDKGAAQKVSMSVTPPATPVAGDLWFNTNRSALYAFYNDGSSSQWVSI